MTEAELDLLLGALEDRAKARLNTLELDYYPDTAEIERLETVLKIIRSLS